MILSLNFYTFSGYCEIAGGGEVSEAGFATSTEEAGQCTQAQIRQNQTIINRCNASWSEWGINPPPPQSELRQVDDCSGVISQETLLGCGDAILALPLFLGQMAVVGMVATAPVDRNTFSYVSQNGSLQEIQAYLAGEFMQEQCGLYPWEVDTYPSYQCPNRESHADVEAHRVCIQTALQRLEEFRACRTSREFRQLYRARRSILDSRARQIKAEQDQRRAFEERRASEISRISSVCRASMSSLNGSIIRLMSPLSYLAAETQRAIAPTASQVQAYTGCVERETASSPELREELIDAADGLISQISASFSSLQCYSGRIRKALMCEISMAVLTGGAGLSSFALRRLGRGAARNLDTRIARGALESERNNQANIIYYPSSDHADIEIDGQVFNTFEHSALNTRNAIGGRFGVSSPRSVGARPSEVLDRAARQSGVSFYRTSVSLSDQEMNTLRAALNSGERNYRTCMGGVCRVLRNATGETIVPTPFNQAPSLSNLYLTIVNRAGSSRITSIQYIGQNQLRDRVRQAGWVGFEGATLAAYGGIAAYTGAIVYTAVNEQGEEEEVIIPIQD